MKLLLCFTWIAFLLSSCVRPKPVIVDAPAGQDSVTVSLVVARGTDLSKIDLSTVPITTTPLPINMYQMQIDAIKQGQDSLRTQLAKVTVPPTTTQLQTLITSLQSQLTTVKATASASQSLAVTAQKRADSLANFLGQSQIFIDSLDFTINSKKVLRLRNRAALP